MSTVQKQIVFKIFSFNKDTCLASNLMKLKHKAVSFWKESGWVYIGFGEIHLTIRNPLPLMPGVHSLNTVKLKPRIRLIEDTFSHRKKFLDELNVLSNRKFLLKYLVALSASAFIHRDSFLHWQTQVQRIFILILQYCEWIQVTN